jgi:4-azaleucine resistance transporter AzlC
LKDLRRGLLATLPLAPGIAAFGLLYGVMARRVGLMPWQVLAMSLIVHAGSAQFVAVGMWGVASGFSIVATTLVINLRHLLMGASLVPHLRRVSRRWKAFLALWLTDESFALAAAAYQQGQGSHTYLLGANLGVYLIWPFSGLLGALLGSAFPLAFLGLLSGFVRDRTGLLVAGLSGGLALLFATTLGGNWHVLLAGLLGSAVGLGLESLRERRCRIPPTPY